MSRWSGRYDFYDSLECHGYTLEELQNNVKIYIGENKTPLNIEKMSDLIPYYPHSIGMAFYNKEKESVIYLSSESYVDIEERELLDFYFKCLLRIYNRCKRKKIEFNVDKAIKEICWNGWNEDSIRKIAERVELHGKKATVDGIHLKMHEIYRQELVDEIIKNGLQPCGNYARFV